MLGILEQVCQDMTAEQAHSYFELQTMFNDWQSNQEFEMYNEQSANQILISEEDKNDLPF